MINTTITTTERASLLAAANSGEAARLAREWYDRQAAMFGPLTDAEHAALRIDLDDIAARRDAAWDREFEALKMLSGDDE